MFFIKGYFADSCDFGVPMREGEFSVFLFGQSSITTGSGAVATAVVHPMLPPKSVETVPSLCFLILYSVFFPECLSLVCQLLWLIHILFHVESGQSYLMQ